MARNMIYDAIGSGVNGFADSALKMMQFADAREERDLRIKREDQAAKRLEIQDARQREQDKLTASDREYQRQRNLTADQRAEEEALYKKSERERTESDRQKAVDQKKAARDIKIMQSLVQMPEGSTIGPDWLPVINRALPEYPDFENIEKTTDGVLLTAREDAGAFILPDGRKTKQLPISNKQLADLVEYRIRQLDGDGLEFLKKLDEATGTESVSPAQRASALGTIINMKRQQASDEEAAGNYKGRDSIMSDVDRLAEEYQKLTGVGALPAGKAPAAVRSGNSPNAHPSREELVKGTGLSPSWPAGTNPAEAYKDVELKRPAPAAPAIVVPPATGVAAPAAPASAQAAQKVKIVSPDGKEWLIPADKVAAAVARGARVVQ